MLSKIFHILWPELPQLGQRHDTEPDLLVQAVIRLLKVLWIIPIVVAGMGVMALPDLLARMPLEFLRQALSTGQKHLVDISSTLAYYHVVHLTSLVFGLLVLSADLRSTIALYHLTQQENLHGYTIEKIYEISDADLPVVYLWMGFTAVGCLLLLISQPPLSVFMALLFTGIVFVLVSFLASACLPDVIKKSAITDYGVKFSLRCTLSQRLTAMNAPTKASPEDRGTPLQPTLYTAAPAE